MKCYKSGGCGVYEMRSCYECPASKPEYLIKKGAKNMVKLTQSLSQWLVKNHPDKLGHLEDFTDEMAKEYLEWCKTDEGRQYLKGGSKYINNY